MLRDPRHFQIAVLGALLLYGAFGLDLEVDPFRAAFLLAAVLATQYLFTRWVGLPAFDPRSALISGLSLCLLLRTDSLPVAVLAAAVTIGSKFLIRWNGKHLFNPTSFGLVAMVLLTGRAWVSPGQWGSAAWLGILLACIGGLVVNRAARSDVTWAFLAFYSGLVLGRALWLGDPIAVPLHHLQSGAFLIFAFFMISDPKTTPDRRSARILYAGLVAAGAGFIHFVLYEPNGFLYSLVAFCPIVPILDRLLPGRRYEWHSSESNPNHTETGGWHEQVQTIPGVPAGGGPGHRHGDAVLRLLRRQGRHPAVQ